MKEDLEQIVLEMFRSGLQYSEAVREFQKMFLTTVLREENANQVKAAKRLGIHRNTLRRQIEELGLDIKSLIGMRRRPPLSERHLIERTRARTTSPRLD